VTAAIALAIVLVVVVAGASMAMESQRSGTMSPPRPPRPARAPDSGPIVGRRSRGRSRKPVDPTSADAPPAPPTAPEPEIKGPELLRSGVAADAKVISVVDERTIGPVTRSRLALRIEQPQGEAFEVTVRVAFQTPESRAGIKVGGTVPVHYDPDDRSRVVVDLPPQ
jgi:hypothetical protein